MGLKLSPKDVMATNLRGFKIHGGGEGCQWRVSAVVVQSCPTLRDPMDQSTPGTPFLHRLPQFGQTHASLSEYTAWIR